jgi:hypothetical protein
MAGMMTHVLGDPHFGALLMQGRAKSAYEVFSLVRDQAALTERLQTEVGRFCKQIFGHSADFT